MKQDTSTGVRVRQGRCGNEKQAGCLRHHRRQSRQATCRVFGRLATRVALVVISVVMIAARPLPAQLLKLDSALAPPPGARHALIEAMTRLDDGIKALEKDATAESDEGPRQRLRVRRFVLAVLQRAADLKDAGAAHVVAGMTLLNAVPSFDRLSMSVAAGPKDKAEQFSAMVMKLPTGKAEIPGTTAELDEALSRWLAPIAALDAALGVSSPKDGSDAQWARSPGRVGWITEAENDAVAIVNALMAQPASPAGGAVLVSDAARKRIRGALPGLIEKSRKVGTVNQSVSLLSSLASGLESCRAMPSWVPKEVQESFRREVESALARVLEPGARSARVEDLRRLAASAELIRHVGQIRQVDTKLLRTVRDLSLKTISNTPKEAARPETAEAIQRVLLPAIREAFTETPDFPASVESNLVREVRPAWRAMEPEHRKAKENYLAAAARACQTDPTPSNPALLAAKSAMRQSAQDLHSLMRVSWWLEGNNDGGLPLKQEDRREKVVNNPPGEKPAPAGSPPNGKQPAPQATNTQPRVASDKLHKAVAARMLKLGQLLAKQPTRDAAEEAIRVFGRSVTRYSRLRGEVSFRAALSGGAERGLVAAFTGPRMSELAGEIDSIRDAFFRSWSEHTGNAAEAANSLPSQASLETLQELLAAIEDAADVERLVKRAEDDQKQAGTTPVRAWCRVQSSPAWESSAGTMRLLSKGVDAALAEATGKLLGQDEAGVAAVIKRVRRDFAVVFLLAELERQAARTGIMNAPAYAEFAEAPAVFHSIVGTTPKNVVWLLERRESLASICWFSEEYAAAMHAGEKLTDREKDAKGASVKYAEALRKYVNDSAGDVLKTLQPTPLKPDGGSTTK